MDILLDSLECELDRNIVVAMVFVVFLISLNIKYWIAQLSLFFIFSWAHFRDKFNDTLLFEFLFLSLLVFVPITFGLKWLIAKRNNRAVQIGFLVCSTITVLIIYRVNYVGWKKTAWSKSYEKGRIQLEFYEIMGLGSISYYLPSMPGGGSDYMGEGYLRIFCDGEQVFEYYQSNFRVGIREDSDSVSIPGHMLYDFSECVGEKTNKLNRRPLTITFDD